MDPINRAIAYHIRTKHQFDRYARSSGFLDWANQPNPFRRFEGAELIRLPVLSPEDDPQSPAYEALYQPGAVASQPLTIRTLSRFLNWRSGFRPGSEQESRSGPLPQQSIVRQPASDGRGRLVQPVEGLDLTPGLYHDAAKEHGVELRADVPPAQITQLLAPFPDGAFLSASVPSIGGKPEYGERAFRYCNHDVGHALGSARIAAATLGWTMLLLDGVEQNQVARLLGTHRQEDFGEAEPEHPDCLAVIWAAESVKRERRA